MKRNYSLMTIVLLALFIGFVSCSKDDDEGIGSFNYDKEILFGTWKITHAEGRTWQYQTTTATFYSDGKYYGSGYFGTGSGTYKLSGGTITCYVDGKEYLRYQVVSLTATEATLIMSASESSITIRCKKQ